MTREQSALIGLLGCALRGERPEAGPNYYQKLSRHYRTVLAESPLELYYAGAVPPKTAAQILRDCFAALPRGEINWELGTEIRMNAVEEAPRTADLSGPQGIGYAAVGWRLGDAMIEPEPAVLKALGCVFGYLARGMEPSVRVDVHKGLLLARCETDAAAAETMAMAMQMVMDTIRIAEFSPYALDDARRARLNQLRALEGEPAALDAYWLEQDLLGLELAPDEYAAFLQEVTLQEVSAAAAAAECDAILYE